MSREPFGRHWYHRWAPSTVATSMDQHNERLCGKRPWLIVNSRRQWRFQRARVIECWVFISVENWDWLIPFYQASKRGTTTPKVSSRWTDWYQLGQKNFNDRTRWKDRSHSETHRYGSIDSEEKGDSHQMETIATSLWRYSLSFQDNWSTEH
jgi:hypothetical protein